MARWKHRAARDTHRTVSAGILDALGRGFLIATAGVVAGLMFGTANPAMMGLWTIGVAASCGVGCMIGSALVRNAGRDRYEKKASGSPRAAHARKAVAASPLLEAAEGDGGPEDDRARRKVTAGRQREHGASVGRGG